MQRNPVLESLLTKYSVRTPRYTSYPTAVDLRPGTFDPYTFGKILQPEKNIQRSLYIHIPFCRSLCYYCACNKMITQDKKLQQQYVEILGQECEIIRTATDKKLSLSAIHLGGGSPSVLTPAELAELFCFLRKSFSDVEDTEKSIELDPRTTTEDFIHTLGQLGFQRVSLGIQDFDHEVQVLINRIQPYDLVAQMVETLLHTGINNINFDLIYGLPGQTPFSFERTVEKVLRLVPQRIALYGYAHVVWKSKVQRVFDKYPLPTPVERYNLFDIARKAFVKAGYVAIGLDHFAHPDDPLATMCAAGKLRRNFMGYTATADEQVIGIGASSISDTGRWLYQNHANVSSYMHSIAQGQLPIERTLQRTDDDILRAQIIERLMCNGCVYFSELPSEPLIIKDLLHSCDQALHNLENDSLIVRSKNVITVTEQGRYFLRSIAAAFDARMKDVMQQSYSSGV